MVPYLNPKPSYFFIQEPQPLLEADLVSYWTSLPQGTYLQTTNGGTIFIIDPGKPNRHAGPDILQATLVIDSCLLQGDVEMHLRSEDWYHHGHHHDARYSQVILHAVSTHRGQGHAPDIPTVCLSGYHPRQKSGQNIHCDLDRSGISRHWKMSVLWIARRRLQHHMDRLQNGFRRYGERQIYRQEMFRMLGAGGNESNFTTLANLTPVSMVLSLSLSEGIQMLDTIAREAGIHWNRCGIRPAHHPEQRLAAAVVICHYIEILLAENPVDPEGLVSMTKSILGPTLGQGLITELLGNVLIPGYILNYRHNSDQTKPQQGSAVWESLQMPYTYQSLKRHFDIYLSATSRVWRSFPMLQGLLSIRKNYCQKRACAICPLKQHHGNIKQN